MKNHIQGKKARIAILISLIIVSLAEVLFRAIAVGEAALGTANAGEQITVLAFAVLILIFTAKGNDKVSYICCGVFVAYFVMDQLFELPGIIVTLAANISVPVVSISVAIRLLTMVGVVVMSGLLVEYVNDGSIYNRAYKATYWITILLHVASIAFCLSAYILPGSSAEMTNAADIVMQSNQNVLIIFNEIYRIIMVVLFTTFAYDSAKRQLKRENLAQ